MTSADSFRPALERLQEQCPEVMGAVLATGEGLILAASGELASDAAAASAVHLIEQADRCVGLLSGEACTALLIWGDSELWCLARLSARCALMVRAGADCRAGVLRLAVQQASRLLEPELAHLGAAPAVLEAGETATAEPVPDPAYYAPA